MAKLSLDDRLNQIEDIISEKSFRENKGLGNEVGYYIFDYDPREELYVRNHIAYLKDRINNGNKDFRIVEFDLFHLMIEILQEEGYLDAFFDLEKENGFFEMADSLVETLGLDETNELNLIISRILQEDLTDSVVFLTGVGKCHPIIASHNILNNLHQVLDTVPVVLFYPGEYSGQDKKLINLVHLGSHAFDEINGEVVQTSSFVFCNENEAKYKSTFIQLVSGKNEDAKATLFLSRNCRFYKTNIQLGEIKGTPYTSYWASDIVLTAFKTAKLVGEISEPRVGMATANNDRFVRLWFEINIEKLGLNLLSRENAIASGKKWFPFAKGGEQRKWYGNNDTVVNWENDGFEIQNFKDEKTGRIRSHNYNLDYIFQSALTWTVIGTQKTTFRFCPVGFLYSNSGYGMFCDNEATKYYLLGFMNSKVAMSLLNILSPSMGFESGYLRKLPIIESNHKDEVVNKVKKCINESNIDWDSFEISWDFKRHPLISVISQNRLLFDDTTDIDLAECYICWENECNERFNLLKANEEELNRIFIDIYGLQDELTPEVEDKDVTVRKADLQRDIKSLISYAVGCMFGRYSIYQDGLMYAGGIWDYSKYKDAAWRAEGRPDVSDFYTKNHYMPDFDNIIPITDEEYFTDDIVGLFEDFIKTVYGKGALEKNLDFVAKALGNKGNTSREVIRNYFLNDFFKDHCNAYSVTGSGKRPIYWLFDSGKQNGFKALIYMHRYDADTVGKVRTEYLHKAQKYVETAMQSAQYTIDNATSSSEKTKATKAVTKYTKQLAEMKIYDEAIAHVANQRIEIDLDDGVKVNYAKFQGVEVSQEGKKALKIDLLAKI